jgi:cell division protein FtsB
MPTFGYRERAELPKPLRFLKFRKAGLLLLGGCTIVLLITFSNKGLLRRISMERDLADTWTRIDELKQDTLQLRRSSDQLRDDLATIERVARESHGMIRRGEVVFRLQAPKPAHE